MTIGRRVRANIIATVEEELQALARRSSLEALKAADAAIAALVKRRHRKEVFVTVVRADQEVCAATVRFEGPISGVGDREYVRIRRSGSEWEKDGGKGMYTAFLSSFGFPREFSAG